MSRRYCWVAPGLANLRNIEMDFKIVKALLLLGSCSLPVSAAPDATKILPTIEQSQTRFQNCLGELEQSSAAQLLAPEIRAQIRQLKFTPKVLKLDRAQPEFTLSFADYLKPRLSEWRINKAHQLYRKHHKLLLQLEQQYGVPGEYLIAFWGLETNFGSYLGNFQILDALATLACNPRRSEFFTAELFNGLHMMQRFGYAKSKLLGSWAGAIGQTQFLPTAYLKYAIDGDQDGKVDLWNSEIDALVSSAYYLQKVGWKNPSRDHSVYNRWGFELNKNDLGLSSDLLDQYSEQRKTLTQWKKLGLVLPVKVQADLSQMAQLLIIESESATPHYFLTFDNYQVILRWNRSHFYAISVGKLADLIKLKK